MEAAVQVKSARFSMVSGPSTEPGEDLCCIGHCATGIRVGLSLCRRRAFVVSANGLEQRRIVWLERMDGKGRPKDISLRNSSVCASAIVPGRMPCWTSLHFAMQRSSSQAFRPLRSANRGIGCHSRRRASGRSSRSAPSPDPRPDCRTRARTGSGWPSHRTVHWPDGPCLPRSGARLPSCCRRYRAAGHPM